MILRRARLPRISWRRLLISLVVLLIVTAASVSGYLASRHSTNQESFFGDFDNPNRVEVTAWITKADAAGQVLSVIITNVRPYGSLSDEGNFAQDATLFTNAVGNWRASIKGGDSAPDIEQRIAVTGTITDYPFDRYKAALELHVVGPDNAELPVALTVLNTDAFFRIDTAEGDPSSGGLLVNMEVQRSTPTLVFAVFIMVLMLGLAAAAAVAAFYVLNWRRGLIFPACSMMAAILFALIPLRNAVPGAPPIGSIIDFGSFFIAEAVISLSLIAGVINGFRHQLAIERAEQGEAEPPTPEADVDEPVSVGPD